MATIPKPGRKVKKDIPPVQTNEKGQFVKGTSGNPKGRPPQNGLPELFRARAKEYWPGIVDVLINQSLEGDMQAMNILITRIVPAIRPVYETVQLEPQVGKSLSERAKAILDAVADGKLSPSDGKTILDGVSVVTKVIEADEIVKRLEAIEQKIGSGPSESD